jgi:hypothetical protein
LETEVAIGGACLRLPCDRYLDYSGGKEKLQPYVAFPLRPDDHLEDDLRIDPDEIDFVALEIAELTSRPLRDCEQNPLYGRVETVADIVLFFSQQQRVA